jgi:hypothetical protein
MKSFWLWGFRCAERRTERVGLPCTARRLLDARDGDGGLHWSTCGEHRQIGLLSQAPGFSGTWATPEDALDVAQSDDCAHYGTKPASSRDKCCETVTLAVPSLALK